jgi:thymidylate kinase
MKIAIIGTHCNGKTTLVEEFLKRWPMYTRPEKTYRDFLTEKKIKLNQKGSKESQKFILDALIDEAQTACASNNKNIIFDRCVVDNLVYSLWLNAKGEIDDNFIIDTKFLVAETVKLFDIVFYLPLDKDIPIEKRKNRDSDPIYREEIDNIFRAVVNTYDKNTGIFFPQRDCPAVITLEGPADLRCDQIQLYIKETGNPYGEEDPSLIYT